MTNKSEKNLKMKKTKLYIPAKFIKLVKEIKKLTYQIVESKKELLPIIKKIKLIGKLNKINEQNILNKHKNKKNEIRLILSNRLTSNLDNNISTELKHFPSSVRE